MSNCVYFLSECEGNLSLNHVGRPSRSRDSLPLLPSDVHCKELTGQGCQGLQANDK
jgi:hypothetical protein